MDPELALLVQLWPTLPTQVKDEALALAERRQQM